MKICLYVHVFDLIPIKKTIVEKLNDFFIRDEKHDMYRTESIKNILDSLKKSGLNGLELIFPLSSSDKDVQKVKEIVEEHKMQVFSIHQSNDSFFNISLSEIEKLCRIAKTFSARVIVLHIDSLKRKIFDGSFVKELSRLQLKYSVSFGVENMPKSPLTLNKSYSYKGAEFSSIIGRTGLSMTFDTTHLGQVNEDICDFYVNNKEKIIDIHLSDYREHWVNRKLLLASGTHLPIGCGELPIIKFLKVLKDNNYKGLITMEINAGLNELCQSASIIRNAFS